MNKSYKYIIFLVPLYFFIRAFTTNSYSEIGYFYYGIIAIFFSIIIILIFSLNDA